MNSDDRSFSASRSASAEDGRTPIRALLFDLDDTLWPIVPVIVAAEEELYEWLRLHAPAVAAAHTVDSMRARRQALMDEDPRHRVDLMALRTLVMHEVFEACGEDRAKIAAGMALFGAGPAAAGPPLSAGIGFQRRGGPGGNRHGGTFPDIDRGP